MIGEKEITMNDEIAFRRAGEVAGYAYNTLKQLRHHGELPFPVYERRMTPNGRPKLFCKISEIEAWKTRATVRVPASTHRD
jgi:hypothetical protein